MNLATSGVAGRVRRGESRSGFQNGTLEFCVLPLQTLQVTDSSVLTPGHALRVKCADQPEEAAKFGRKLADAGVNIDGLLEVSICQGEVIFAIAVD
jgi:hypothetical protein